MKSIQLYILLVTAAILAGCASSGQRAPVVEHSESAKKKAVAVETARKKK